MIFDITYIDSYIEKDGKITLWYRSECLGSFRGYKRAIYSAVWEQLLINNCNVGYIRNINLFYEWYK